MDWLKVAKIITENTKLNNNNMENYFKSPQGLPYLSKYKKERESKINSLINNLKISDVKEDTNFINTTSRIKKLVVLYPIVMGEPKFVDHEFEEIPLTMTQQLIGGMSRNHYTHQIDFPFTGNGELFSYIPENGYSQSSERGIILPYGNTITVYVDLPELNPERAIAVARGDLSMNFQFMDNNNASVQSWTVVIGQRIDEQLKQKREELIKLYGGK